MALTKGRLIELQESLEESLEDLEEVEDLIRKETDDGYEAANQLQESRKLIADALVFVKEEIDAHSAD